MQIAAHDLSVGYGARRVLEGIDLVLRPGELVGLIGPNGAGKSTLLRVLAGLLPPLSGRVRYDGAALGGRALARRLAFLAQGGEVNWALSAQHLVALGRLPHRGAFAAPSPHDAAAVDRAFAAADADHLRQRVVGTLSGGERMRILLARALAVEAEMLLADEPIAALDPLHQLRVMGLLRDAVARGTGIVVVLHDLALACRFCDRLVLVAQGRVLADGPPETVLGDAAIAAAYGIGVLRGTHQGQPFMLPWSPLV